MYALGVTEILELLRSLVRERNMAILLSSHLLNQVQHVCDRIGIFTAGKLIGMGTMADLARKYGAGKAHLEVGLDVTDATETERIRGLLTAIPGVDAVTVSDRPIVPLHLA